MYTIHKQVPKSQQPIKFGQLQKFYTEDNEFDRVNLPREETITKSSQIALTRSLLNNVVQPYEHLLRHIKLSKFEADHELQGHLSYVVNSSDMIEGVLDALTQTASLLTFEERAAMAEQLQILHTMAQARSRLSVERVRETSTACHDHVHMLLKVHDVHEEASRCLEQGDVERAYELAKAMQSYLPYVHSRSGEAKRLTIPCLAFDYSLCGPR